MGEQLEADVLGNGCQRFWQIFFNFYNLFHRYCEC